MTRSEKTSKLKAQGSKVILLFGPPGAGKGTQAELIGEKFGFVHFEMSKTLEHWIKTGSLVEVEGKQYFPEKQKKLWETGILLDPPIVSYLGIQEIGRLHKEGKSIVTSGAFRTKYEAGHVYPVFKELYGAKNVRVLHLILSEEETLFRNSHRRICKLMRHPILWLAETKDLTICPLDGSALVRRKGLDDPETIKVRLKEYAERTLPVLDFLRSVGVSIQKINGDQSVAQVFREIAAILEKE